jgi:hypothetical protein
LWNKWQRPIIKLKEKGMLLNGKRLLKGLIAHVSSAIKPSTKPLIT